MSFWSKVLDVVQCGDWVTPTIGLVEDLAGWDTVVEPIPAGYSVNDVVRALERQGVKVSHRSVQYSPVESGHLMISVDRGGLARDIIRSL